MISDELFAECLVILQDENILDEDQAERISALISSKTDLEGSTLDNEVLDVLWRHRTKSSPASSPPIRNNHTIIRRASPAPWQFPRVGTPTPSLGGTPPLAPGFPPSLRSSPFPSPRPSPRLAYSSPLIPHSPTLNNYEPVLHHDVTSAPAEAYGDLGSETVQWLIGDDSNYVYGVGPTQGMTPHDMLRSVLGEGRSDEEIDQALDICSYDLAATLAMLMEQQQHHPGFNLCAPVENAAIIGKSTTPNPERSRPITPRNGIVCRFFLSTGQCLRADCRYSHDLGTTICKYWLMGSCLAGNTCIFSHDPTMSVSKMTLGADSRTSTPPPSFQFQDASAFPSLSPGEHWNGVSGVGSGMTGPSPGFKLTPSRPHSRQQNRDRNQDPSIPLDDSEAFPSLGSAKNHKKRDRRPKNDIPTGPSSLAEIVRMGSPGPNSNRWAGVGGSPNSKRGNSKVSASHIPAPQQIPWLDTGSSLNRLYLKHRKVALNHGVLRAKYLQMASGAWQRNDAKAAKEHSRKANNENLAMVKAHKEAARAIYEERNKQPGVELFVDLHGLLPDEGVKYLEEILVAHQNSSQPLYAIVGTGHHSKGGKDKLSRAIRAFLDEWKYAYREFSVSGDRNGGILGIDPRSFDKAMATAAVAGGCGDGQQQQMVAPGVDGIGSGSTSSRPMTASGSGGSIASAKKKK